MLLNNKVAVIYGAAGAIGSAVARVARVQEDSPMNIANTTVLVTGANRGIGQALVEEALRRGATRVYATTRRPLAHPDERVTP
jgi:NAD(P)-dependent dehydrogenase (short-subunit alcohol dehydrogenase family)